MKTELLISKLKNCNLLVVFFLTVLSGLSLASEGLPAQQMFVLANEHFEKGDLSKAEEIYSSLTRQGYEGTALYYNLGNLYYRRGERGKAILWYERASQLSPRDADTQFNLSLARSHIRDEKDNLLRKIILTFTATELSWASLIFIWLFFSVLSGVILGGIKSEVWPQVHLWLTGILLVICLSWLGVNNLWARQPLAIVTSPPGEVRNGPGTDYAVGFTIPEGSKVLLLGQRPEWVQVGVPHQGLKGWMPARDVETITVNPVLSN
jgi:hypothetical protein